MCRQTSHNVHDATGFFVRLCDKEKKTLWLHLARTGSLHHTLARTTLPARDVQLFCNIFILFNTLWGQVVAASKLIIY